jgi:hypothetical protein
MLNTPLSLIILSMIVLIPVVLAMQASHEKNLALCQQIHSLEYCQNALR